MRKALAGSLFALMLATGPAMATGTISCESDNGAGFSLGIGTVPGMAVVSALVFAGDFYWTMSEDQLAVSQAFSDGESIRVDFTDANLNELIARIRLFQAHEEADDVMAGTLEVMGVGAYAVSCEGP